MMYEKGGKRADDGGSYVCKDTITIPLLLPTQKWSVELSGYQFAHHKPDGAPLHCGVNCHYIIIHLCKNMM